MNPTVTIKTNLGEIKLQLDAQKAPISTQNFVQYARDGHYDGTVFHRVIQGFMIQGGGMSESMQSKKTRAPIKNESTNNLPNDRYTVAMARTSVPDSATSQFFINTSDNDFLNREKAADGVGYAVFGEVIEGKEIVDQIEKVKTGNRGGHSDVPVDPVIIESVTVEDDTE